MRTYTYPPLERIVASLAADPDSLASLRQKGIGLEKESLRVNEQGLLMQTSHPVSLGAALTHPYITTDFSEAQLELITPQMHDNTEALAFVHDLHAYIYQRMEPTTVLWANSMPCVVKNSERIPIARYGASNLGQMKHIYRQGLHLRYGSSMQVISGVHFNYSLHKQLWPSLQSALQASGELFDFRNRCYMGMVRNLIRYNWIIPYLFGASPAVCRAFVDQTGGDLQAFDEATLFEPGATSLRMGNVGYQNNREIKTGLNVSYNDLTQYIACLRNAVTTEYPDYQALGVKTHAQYQQLNANLLQIENEYYATVRPKRTANQDEMSLLALHRAGIEYVELRALDVNPFERTGLNLSQLYFLEALFLFCMLTDSPPLSADEQRQCNHNEIVTAHRGREPGLQLQTPDKSRPLCAWGEAVCQAMLPVGALLDKAHGGERYQQAIQAQSQLFMDSELTLSARILDEMRSRQEDFVTFTLRYSHKHRHAFLHCPLDAERAATWDGMARDSLAEQQRIEACDQQDMDTYIADYFAQLARLDEAP